MTFEELKREAQKRIDSLKELHNVSERCLESDAIRRYRHQYEEAKRWGYGYVEFNEVVKFVKNNGLSMRELDAAESDGLVLLYYASNSCGIGKFYADYFLFNGLYDYQDMFKIDYEALGNRVKQNINKIFKSAVYKEGVGILILDMDEAEDVWEKMEIARKNLDASIPMMSND